MKTSKFDPSSVRFTTDASNRRIAKVPLCHGRGVVTLLAADYARLVGQGRGPTWYLSGNGRGCHYVLARNPFGRKRSDNTVLARMIAGVPARKRIGYVDGDRLNLLPENLILQFATLKQRAKTDFSNDNSADYSEEPFGGIP